MDCYTAESSLSDYLDHALPIDRKMQLEAHLDQCGSCRLLCSDLRAILCEVKSLPQREANPNMWHPLMARVNEMASPRGPVRWRDSFKSGLQDLSLFGRPSFAVSIAILLALVSVTILFWKPSPNRLSIVANQSTEEIAVAEIRQAEFHYQKAIFSLKQMIASRKSSWDPQFARVFESNLKKIDEAVEECRQAVKQYPNDLEANMFLLEAYNQEVDFLHEVLQIRI